MDFSTRLKEIRNMMGYTQAEVAQTLGIATRSYRNYELGSREPSLSFLVSLADTFCVSLDELIGREPFVPDSLSSVFDQMLPYIEELNETGRKEAIKRIAELAEIPKYRNPINALTDRESPARRD